LNFEKAVRLLFSLQNFDYFLIGGVALRQHMNVIYLLYCNSILICYVRP